MTPTDPIQITPAIEADIPLILSFIQGIAAYEKLSHEVVATEQSLRETLFGERPFAEVLIARSGEQPAGFALFFHNYSTFLAQPGIYLEDLFVLPELRGRGIGKALLLEVVKTARRRGCGRVEWSVLDWNEPAIQFYKSVGATPMEEWTTYRMTAETIDRISGALCGEEQLNPKSELRNPKQILSTKEGEIQKEDWR